MWWFALIMFLNFVVPTRMLYDSLGVYILGFRATPLDALVFLGPVIAMVFGWHRTGMPVTQRHRAFSAAMFLLVLAIAIAAIVGLMRTGLIWSPQWYFAPFRNLLIVPISAYMGYCVLRHPSQCRPVVWIIFTGSLAAAAGSALTSGQAAAEMAVTSKATFDTLRDARAQASGEAGLLAACLLIFSFVARVRILPLPLALACLGISGLGMFFVVHRSAWLMCAMVLAFAGLYLWPVQRIRGIAINIVLATSIILSAVLGVALVQRASDRDFSSWVMQRVESMLPGDDYTSTGRAWDTRLPGLWFDLEIWMQNPLLGGGFGAHEFHRTRTGTFLSMRHTPWTSTLAESGVPGLAAFALVVGGLIVVGTRLARTGPDAWMMLLGALGACTGFSAFILGWFTLSWNTPRQAVILGLMFGLVMRCRDMAMTVQWNQAPIDEDLSGHSTVATRGGF